MIVEYRMPKLAMAMNEGTVNEWLVADGNYVEAGAPIAIIETEKVAYDCESPESGYFFALIEAGETVDCDVLIGCFCTEAAEIEDARAKFFGDAADDLHTDTPTKVILPGPEDSSAQRSLGDAGDCSGARASAARRQSRRIKASPAARKLARTNGIELAALTASGPHGRVVKRDVLSYLEAPAERAPGDLRVLGRTPIRGLRRTIAERMTQSLAEAAQVSGHFEADVSRLLALRQRFVDREEAYGTRVSVNALIVKAIACAIARVPQVNACVEGEEVVVYGNVHMGIATSLPGSHEMDSALVVAVLRDVDRKGVVEIDQDMKALLHRVREGRGTPEDLSGSTITLSSTAGIGPPGLTSTPVLNRPNVFMLGPSTPVERVRCHEGDYVNSPMMPVSYTFDHRAIDGEPTARFLAALAELLTEPELMLA